MLLSLGPLAEEPYQTLAVLQLGGTAAVSNLLSSSQDASVLSMIPALGPSLKVLDLSSCVALTNQTMQAICTYLIHLSVLRLAWCKELQDWGLLGLKEPSDEPVLNPQV